jgi:hypothetical protein
MLSNTITLPEDTNGANAKLDALLVDPAAAVYLFIFGETAQIEQFGVDADGVAGGALRRVVRRSKVADLMDRFKALKLDPEAGDLGSNDLVGFSTSGHLVISDVVLSTESLNSMRAADAFMQAEGEA